MTDPPGTFVEYVGIAHAPGPLRAMDPSKKGPSEKGLKMWSHRYDADPAALQRLLQRVFNDTTGGAVTAVPQVDVVLLTLTRFGTICTDERGYCEMGHTSERNVAFWVPTTLTINESDGGSRDCHAMFLAGMWVDDPIALVAGREVWGYAKHFGEISLPDETEDGSAELKGWVWNFDGDEPYPAKRDLLTVTPRQGEPPATTESLSDAELNRLLADFIGVDVDAVDPAVLDQPIDRAFRQLMLRQFRNPHLGEADPPSVDPLEWATSGTIPPSSHADLQQVLIAEMTIKNITTKVRQGPMDLKITPYDSHPIAAHLGLGDAPTWLKDTGLLLEGEFDVQLADVHWSLR
jgi:Acetoacetate decarboxylase (ADC)